MSLKLRRTALSSTPRRSRSLTQHRHTPQLRTQVPATSTPQELDESRNRRASTSIEALRISLLARSNNKYLHRPHRRSAADPMTLLSKSRQHSLSLPTCFTVYHLRIATLVVVRVLPTWARNRNRPASFPAPASARRPADASLVSPLILKTPSCA